MDIDLLKTDILQKMVSLVKELALLDERQEQELKEQNVVPVGTEIYIKAVIEQYEGFEPSPYFVTDIDGSHFATWLPRDKFILSDEVECHKSPKEEPHACTHALASNTINDGPCVITCEVDGKKYSIKINKQP